MLFYIVFGVPIHEASWQLSLYHHTDTVQLSFGIMTHNNILTSSITDPVCKSGNRDDKVPEGFQLQESPCTTDTDQSLSYESLNITAHN